MAWNTLTIDDVRFTPAERARLDAIAGSVTIGESVLANVVGEFRDAAEAVGTPLGDDGTVPDMVRMHVINRTRWLWLCEFPELKVMQTEMRKNQSLAAEKMLDRILAREIRLPAGDGSTPDATVLPSVYARDTHGFDWDSQDGL